MAEAAVTDSPIKETRPVIAAFRAVLQFAGLSLSSGLDQVTIIGEDVSVSSRATMPGACKVAELQLCNCKD